jgi:predicted Zn-dependent peptidase
LRASVDPTEACNKFIETAAMMREGSTEEELVQAKNKVLARSVLRSERPMGRLALLGFNWMYHGAYISVEQELEAINRVTRDDLGLLLVDWPLWPMRIVSVGPQVSGQWPVVGGP